MEPGAWGTRERGTRGKGQGRVALLLWRLARRRPQKGASVTACSCSVFLGFDGRAIAYPGVVNRLASVLENHMGR